jgi:hypothetical protein
VSLNSSKSSDFYGGRLVCLGYAQPVDVDRSYVGHGLTELICRVFYWFGAYYDRSLLLQASLMIIVQLILLKVALDNRAPNAGAEKSGGVAHTPFSNISGGVGAGTGSKGMLYEFLVEGKRPWGFWQWKASKPYAHHIPSATAATVILTLLRL